MSPNKFLIAAAVLIAAALVAPDALARPGDRAGDGRRPGENARVDDHRGSTGPVARGHGHRGPGVRGHPGSRFGRHFGKAHRGPRAHFFPGRYETRYRQVWIPAFYRSEFVPPVYRTQVRRHGRVVRRILVCAGHTRQVLVPGRYETRAEQVWVPGCWSYGR